MSRHYAQAPLDLSPPAQPLLRKPVISVRMQEYHSKHGVLHRKAATTAATSYLLQELALAVLTQTWAEDAISTVRPISRLMLIKPFGGSCKSKFQGPGQTSAHPDFRQQLQCKVL